MERRRQGWKTLERKKRRLGQLAYAQREDVSADAELKSVAATAITKSANGETDQYSE